MRITAFFDLAFALATERHMDHLRPDQIEMLGALARFQIAAHAAARAAAPARSEAAARQVAACEQATQTVLRRALATGDRELARQPLREVAVRLGITPVEDTEDWNRLAYEATRVLLDASHQRERHELGAFQEPSPLFRSARARMNDAGGQTAQDWSQPVVAASFVPPAAAPAAVFLPVAPGTPATGPARANLPILAVTGSLEVVEANRDPAPCDQDRAPEPIGHADGACDAAACDPARDALALRTKMHPPKLGNLPLDRLSPAIRQVLRKKPRGITLSEP